MAYVLNYTKPLFRIYRSLSRGFEITGASSDHLIVNSGNGPNHIGVGTEIVFQLNYSALLRAMTSPYVTKIIVRSPMATPPAEIVRSSRA